MDTNLAPRFETILSDPRLLDDDADEAQLKAEYGADNVPQALYRLVDTYGWTPVYQQLVALLRDNARPERWETAQIVLFYAAGSHPMPADATIALLHHRFPGGIDDGDRIWAITCALKRLNHGADYEPMRDPGVLEALRALAEGAHDGPSN